MRGGGYHAASFRDIAAAVAIKSASVHYHFPTKEDLGAAVLRRYLDRTLATLGDPLDPEQSPQALLNTYVALFRRALEESARTVSAG
jgi:TetR/AcrR family transcriptional regulator, transcriptional repressor for nem operon